MMNGEEKIARVNTLLEKLPMYGEFLMVRIPPLRQTKIINGGDFLNPENKILEDIEKSAEALKAEENLNKIEFAKDEEAMNYLIFEGFVINRHDIRPLPNEVVVIPKLYRQLTDKGRQLKEAGSIEAFNLVAENNNRKMMLQDQRSERLYWINFWIAVGAIVAALYYSKELWVYFFHSCHCK
jgi:hypothetical protein